MASDQRIALSIRRFVLVRPDSPGRLFYSVLTIAAVLIPLVTQAQMGPKSPSSESVTTALRERDYDKALLLVRRALKNQPDNVSLLTTEGIILRLDGDDHAALATFNRALRLSPHYPRALEGRAEIEYQNGDPQAKHDLENLLLADAGNETAHAMLGVIAAERANYKVAISEFQQAHSAVWSNQRSLQIYGNCLQRLDRSKEAIPVFQRLLVLSPLDSAARYNLAVVQFYSGAATSALETLQPLLVGEGIDPEILSLASDVFEATGNTPKAVELLREAIVRQPTEPTYYVSFAALTFDHASFQVGIDMIDAGLRILPNDASLHTARGLLYVQLGQDERADIDFRQAQKLSPESGMGGAAQSLLEAVQTDPDHILDKLQTRLKEQPSNPFLNFLLARVLYDRGAAPGSPEFKQAMQAVQKAIKLEPELIYARNLLTNLYLDAGETDLAIAHCRATLKLAPDDQTTLYHLIKALRQSGRTNELQPLVQRMAAVIKSAHEVEDNRKRMRIMDDISSRGPERTAISGEVQ